MKKKRKADIRKLMSEGSLVDEAIAKAIREAVHQHIRAGNPIAAVEGGKIHLLKSPWERVAKAIGQFENDFMGERMQPDKAEARESFISKQRSSLVRSFS